MTRAAHNYTDPFRKDYAIRLRNGRPCSVCGEASVVAIVHEDTGHMQRFCAEHNPKRSQEVEPDVRPVPPAEG